MTRSHISLILSCIILLLWIIYFAASTIDPVNDFRDKSKQPTKVSEVGRNVTKIEVKEIRVGLMITDKDCLYAHSVVRKLHSTPKFIIDDELTREAQEWAITLVVAKEMDHGPNPDENGIYFGENLFEQEDDKGTCQLAVHSWNKEEKDYDYDNPKWKFNNGHFIQIVYPEVVLYGIGVAMGNKKTYVVGRYKHGVRGDTDFKIKKPTDEKKLSVNDLYPSNPETPIHKLIEVPENGGWTNWINATMCTKTCGEDDYDRRRYCITENPQKLGQCSGEGTQTISCNLPPCATKFSKSSTSGGTTSGINTNGIGAGDEECVDECEEECKDVVSKGLCMEKDVSDSTKKKCPRSCSFCKPCSNSHPDCPEYARAPYDYCTDKNYRDWMLEICAKSCNHCHKRIATNSTGCRDLKSDCEKRAHDQKQCMVKETVDYMKDNCKWSCRMCQDCVDKGQYCGAFAGDAYGYCTDSKYTPWMLLNCAKSCGYCYNG